MGEVSYPAEWQEKAPRILESGRLIVLVGGIDSGKTTFASYLVNRIIEAGLSCAVVDADVGQASIGPPAVISLGFPESPVERLSDIPMDSFYFVGAISPQGHLLPCVVGTRKMVEQAWKKRNPDRIVVDTTGLVRGRVGRTLKAYKLDLLEPDVIVFFQRRKELEDLARVWERRARVFRLRVAAEVQRKTFEERARSREEKWRLYFAGSTRHELPLKELAFSRGILGAGQPLEREAREKLSSSLGKKILWAESSSEQGILVVEERLSEDELLWIKTCLGSEQADLHQLSPLYFRGLLVALLKGGEARALGIVQELDFEGEKISILSPLPAGEKIAEIQFGSYRFPLINGQPIFQRATFRPPERSQSCGD
ncbi:Clp1/GlmU family protein [Ammonifex degensii]|nr:Clp1/GlmU family protein [Ammonifex degensii]